MSTTPVPLTRADFLKMSAEDLKKIVKDPEKLAEANAIMAELDKPVPETPEIPETPVIEQPDAAKIEADRIVAETAKAAAETAKLAELEAYKAAGLTVETDAAGNITRIVKTYQARDEAGNPIGRPTYLEAKNWAELSVKQQNAHEHAVRFGERVKKQVGKITVKKEETETPLLSEQELIQFQEELKGGDKDKIAKAAEAIRRNNDAKTIVEANKAIEDARQARESFAFLADHINDFNRCEANNKMLTDYIRDNQLEWTKDNLESAFIALESQLAPKEQPAPKVPDNPAPVVPAPVTPPPVAGATPVPPVVPNNPAPPTARPGVNGGLVPGEQSAQRPNGKPKGLTKEDVKKMSREEYRRRLKDPKFVAEVNALQIRGGL